MNTKKKPGVDPRSETDCPPPISSQDFEEAMRPLVTLLWGEGYTYNDIVDAFHHLEDEPEYLVPDRVRTRLPDE